jgi:hypothetical protein
MEKPLTAGDDRSQNTFLITPPLDELTWLLTGASLSHYIKLQRENESLVEERNFGMES